MSFLGPLLVHARSRKPILGYEYFGKSQVYDNVKHGTSVRSRFSSNPAIQQRAFAARRMIFAVLKDGGCFVSQFQTWSE